MSVDDNAFIYKHPHKKIMYTRKPDSIDDIYHIWMTIETLKIEFDSDSAVAILKSKQTHAHTQNIYKLNQLVLHTNVDLKMCFVRPGSLIK